MVRCWFRQLLARAPHLLTYAWYSACLHVCMCLLACVYVLAHTCLHVCGVCAFMLACVFVCLPACLPASRCAPPAHAGDCNPAWALNQSEGCSAWPARAACPSQEPLACGWLVCASSDEPAAA